MENREWKTAISKIEPDNIQIRGFKIEELMDSLKFTDLAFLTITGKLPSTSESRIFQAMINSSIDHGVTPPSVLATLNSASTGAPVNVAIASGILSINKFHGGAIEDCMFILHNINQVHCASCNKELAETVETEFLKIKEKKVILPGFGHRIHKNDPRTLKLLQIIEEENFKGPYIQILLCLQEMILKHSQKKLPVNVDGAIAGALCELGIDPKISNGFFILSRIPGLIAHYLEEEIREKKMRKILPGTEKYDGETDLKL